jgi:hypothetical protein
MWSVIEDVPGLITLARVWRNLLGEDFARMSGFMRPHEELASRAPCGRCCCSHRVVPRGELFIGICECEGFSCQDIALARDDIVLLQFDVPRLGRVVARSLGCEAREHPIAGDELRQVAIFGASALPILLAVPRDPESMVRLVTQLAARLSGPFVALVPTMRFVDIRTLDLLNSRQAGVFGLDSLIEIDRHGRARALKSAGELFSRFVRCHPPSDQGAAEEAFAMIEKLDSGPRARAPSLVSVFRLYCMESLAADEIAARCGCSKGTVVNRLKTIRRVTGLAPEALRRKSGHLERPRDSRARTQFLATG